MKINPIYLKDMYKVGHYEQYPTGTSLVFSNFTPRKSRMDGVNHSVFFGLKYLIQEYLIDSFNHLFFNSMETFETYRNVMHKALGSDKNYDHINALRKLGYLPIAIYALPEGTVVPCGVPALVIYNTHPDFYWLPNMLETLISTTLWGACTSATIAREYRIILDKYAALTSDIPEFVDYQAHDFSMRGMFGVEAATISGMAHLNYFKGTDTLPAYLANNKYYDKEFTICSVPATEHSVMSAGGKEDEFGTYKRLINDVYPSGIVSIVSDTYDLWHTVSDYLPRLRNDIMRRDGKVVIRPDSGDPVDILCGTDKDYTFNHGEKAWADIGLIPALWDIFGGTINSKGFKQLDPHIGAIYGDSITLDRCKSICERLREKGFASTNVVFGIGSYSYQMVTRDTLGWAMKATYCEVNGVGRDIYKDPITDDGTKKSHKGILKVVRREASHGASLQALQQQTWDQFHEADNELKLVFKDGKLCKS